MLFPRFTIGLVATLPLLALGCSSEDDAPVAETVMASSAPQASATPQQPPATTPSGNQANSTPESSDAPAFAPLNLTALGGRTSDSSKSQSGSAGSAEQQIQAVIRQLQPLQVLLGQWRGTTRREFESFKAVDSHEWVWDLRTDPAQPALTLNSDKSPYLRKGRLTWDTRQQKFLLTAVDAEGKE
ncbi:MAG: hypothetical protein ACKO2P_20415, partial [Planctomycetota bacterium]